MDTGDVALAAYGYGVAALLHAAYALRLIQTGQWRKAGRALPLFAAAVASTAVWAGCACVLQYRDAPVLEVLLRASDLARYGLWFFFLLALLRPSVAGGRRAERSLLPPAAGVLVALGVVSLLVGGLALAPGLPRFSMLVSLALPVLGLVLLEQLFRNVADDSRWNAKPLCLGLGLLFVFDLYLYSEAALLARFDSDAISIRGAIHALVIPFLFTASRRHDDWTHKLQVSRTAVFHSATLLLAGVYLLFVSAVGYYVRYFGGQWGRALQLGLLFVAVAFLAGLVFSGSMRAKLRVMVGKHFFSYRYDYRQEWLRFTATLSASGGPQEMGRLVIRGLADMLESPAGCLWSKGPGGTELIQTAHWNLPRLAAREAVDSPFCQFLLTKGWIVDLQEVQSHPDRYGHLAVPAWLLASEPFWLVVPLIVGSELIGFVVLARPRTAIDVNWEVSDLLKTASRQAAGFLAQMHATEALLEVRKFDAFNRMSAFVVHDLKNIVTQLSLMLKNAKRLRDNPEFQEDMLMTLESSLEKMRQLMLQLREGATPPGAPVGVDLVAIVRRLEAVATGRGRTLDATIADRVLTRGQDERIERVLGHIVQNAFDATPPSGTVSLRLSRSSGQAVIEVTDTGVGMSEEFVQTRLFKPFQTTKETGMGIGAYESYQYVQELGGRLSVKSRPGEGTTVSVVLPLFETRSESDLQMLSTP